MAKPFLTTMEKDGKFGLNVNLHPGQIKLMESKSPVTMVIAGNQSGKTICGPIWLCKEIMERGAGDYIAASADFGLMQKKMIPALKELFCRELGYQHLKGDRFIVNEKAGVTIFLCTGFRPDSLESATAKAAWCDEWGQDGVTLEAWDAVVRRVGHHQGRILLTHTPYNLSWTKTEIYDRWKGGDPHYEVINFSFLDNPTNPPEEYYRRQKEMPDWKFQMFYNGVYTRPSGLIYSDFDESKHVVKAFKIPDTWRRYVGVDFGLVHTAILWLAEDAEDGKYYVYRESLGGGLTQAEWAKRCLDYNEPVIQWRGGAASEDVHRRAWSMTGVPLCEPTIRDVEGGIDNVIGLIKQNRLRVFETMTGLRSEFAAYSRELDASGQPTEKIADKQTYHHLDALRYICSSLSVRKGVKVVAPESPRRLRVLSGWNDDRNRIVDELDIYS